MNVLVSGGAGYIGSHAVRRLRRDGHGVVVLDNLCRGHRAAVPGDVPLIQADLADTARVETTLNEYGVEAVMNFAALTYVGESVEQPLAYYQNNTAGVLSLLRAMARAGVRRFVQSSTAAVYGEPETMPITEDTPRQPINPYGASKLMVEQMLQDQAGADPGFAFAALRYFNVAGAAGDGSIGEDHDPETHLIPILIQAALGQRDKAIIFGDDYPTPDGTCVRDYVHVEDLVNAHAVVLAALEPSDQRYYNLGIGHGLSVKQVVDAVKKVTGVDFRVEIGDRRPGDPPALYADPSRIADELGWRAKVTDVEQMVTDAWRWFENRPGGYGD